MIQQFYWHLELSTKCFLKCPRCPRALEKNNKLPNTELDLSFIKKVFPPEKIKEIRKILFCGGQGDPIYCSEFLEIIEYFKSVKEDISLIIVTNGSYKQPDFWNRLSKILNGYDTIVFSVDGWDNESNNLYRINSDYDSILTGVNIMSTSEANVRWSTILFKFNQDKLDLIETVAKDNGADFFNLSLSTLFGSNMPMFIDEKLGYDPLEPCNSFKNTQNKRTERYIKKLTSKPILVNDYYELYNKLFNDIKNKTKDYYIMPLCETGHRGLYIDVLGNLYPCCWIANPYEIRNSNVRKNKTIKWNDSLFVKNKEKFNLNNNSIDSILNSAEWLILPKHFKNKESSFVECEDKCLNKSIDFETLTLNEFKLLNIT